MGRLLVVRMKKNSYRYPGGTPHPLCDVGPGQEQGHQDGDQRTDQASAQVTAGTLQVTDLGSWQGAGRSSTLLTGHRHQGVFLRSAAAVATWLKREHQRITAAVLPEGHGSLQRSPEQVERCRSKT